MGGDYDQPRKTGSDTILGDNGIVEMDAKGINFAKVNTKSQASTGGSIVSLGGDDTITAQDGTKIVLAVTVRTRSSLALQGGGEQPHRDR